MAKALRAVLLVVLSVAAGASFAAHLERRAHEAGIAEIILTGAAFGDED